MFTKGLWTAAAFAATLAIPEIAYAQCGPFEEECGYGAYQVYRYASPYLERQLMCPGCAGMAVQQFGPYVVNGAVNYWNGTTWGGYETTPQYVPQPGYRYPPMNYGPAPFRLTAPTYNFGFRR